MVSRRRVGLRGLVAGAALVTAIGLATAGSALAANQAVAISGFSFSPATVTVSIGDTVTWTNSDAQAHTATADSAAWDSGTIAGSGGTGAVTFSTAGSFPYHCTIHPTMTGTVTVQAAAGGGGAGATTPPTDTNGGPSADTAGAATAGSWSLPLVVIALGWLLAIGAVARRVAAAR